MRDAILVGAKTCRNVRRDMAGALTDKPAGKDVDNMPYEQHDPRPRALVRDGGEQGKPSLFDGADLRAWSRSRAST